MANTAKTKERLRRWATLVEQDAATRIVNSVSKATPRETGRLERARRRRDVTVGTKIVTQLVQEAGAGEPAELPEWLDRNVQFPIEARPGGVLRFRVRGGRVLFRKRVQWRPRPESVGFWSRNVNARTWSEALDDAAGRQRF